MENKNKCNCNCKNNKTNLQDIIKKYLKDGKDPQEISDSFLESLNASVQELKQEKENEKLILEARDDLIISVFDYMKALGVYKEEDNNENNIIQILNKLFKSFEDSVKKGETKFSFNIDDPECFKNISSFFFKHNPDDFFKNFDILNSFSRLF